MQRADPVALSARCRRGAGRQSAAADGARRSAGVGGQPGRAWAAQGRHRPKLLAVPPLPPRRCGDRHRLAAIGQVRSISYVREREWEAAQSVWLWRDGSPSMRFTSGGESKIDRASLLALALACCWCAAASAWRLYGEREAPGQFARRLSRASAMRCRALAPPTMRCRPSAASPRNAQFVWFGDFLAPLGEIEAAIRRLTRHNAGGRLVHIVDPAEEDFPYCGPHALRSRAGQRRAASWAARKAWRADYRARFKAHGEAVALLARKLGWTYLDASHRPFAADRAGGAVCRSRRRREPWLVADSWQIEFRRAVDPVGADCAAGRSGCCCA